jgi:hypothetical protein
MQFSVTNIISRTTKQQFDLLLKSCNLTDILSFKIIDVHKPIKYNKYCNKKKKGQLIEKKIIDIIKNINNVYQDEFSLNIQQMLLSNFKDYKYKINCKNYNIRGQIDFIFDDFIIDCKVIKPDENVIDYKTHLQLLLYYCISNYNINKIGKYDYYNGKIYYIETTNIDKEKVIDYIQHKYLSTERYNELRNKYKFLNV